MCAILPEPVGPSINILLFSNVMQLPSSSTPLSRPNLSIMLTGLNEEDEMCCLTSDFEGRPTMWSTSKQNNVIWFCCCLTTRQAYLFCKYRETHITYDSSGFKLCSGFKLFLVSGSGFKLIWQQIYKKLKYYSTICDLHFVKCTNTLYSVT